MPQSKIIIEINTADAATLTLRNNVNFTIGALSAVLLRITNIEQYCEAIFDICYYVLTLQKKYHVTK